MRYNNFSMLNFFIFWKFTRMVNFYFVLNFFDGPENESDIDFSGKVV